MIYPSFLKKGDTIGIFAPSAGVGRDLDSYLESIKTLKKQGYKIKETSLVRSKLKRSGSGKKRAKEFYDLCKDKKVNFIMCAAGGDYMLEMMPYVNYDEFILNPKWVMGASDPTNILLDITCNLDIATIYGFNGGSYSLLNPKWQQDNLSILKGDLVTQKSYKKYQTCIDKYSGVNNYNHDVKWICKKEIDIKGRIIGGCFEIIQSHIGTFLDNMNGFVCKYIDDGIIWYFDIYSCTPLDFYLGLLKMRYAGLFTNCKGVLIGRVALPHVEDKKFDYQKAADRALGDIPHVMEMDIGHTNPHMTIINGALATLTCHNGNGKLSFELK